MSDTYDQTGREGLTSKQLDFMRTLPENQQAAFTDMKSVERDVLREGFARPQTPNADRNDSPSGLEARVKALEGGAHLRAGKGISLDGPRISLKDRQDRGGGAGGGGAPSAETYPLTLLSGGASFLLNVYYQP